MGSGRAVQFFRCIQWVRGLAAESQNPVIGHPSLLRTAPNIQFGWA